MSIIFPEIEYIDRSEQSIRYLEHGWPSDLCRWHSHEEYELHLIVSTSGRAFVGDYIGDFKPGSLFLTGPNLPHNWISDESLSKPVGLRDMLVQFNQASIDELAYAFPEFKEMTAMFELAASGIEFVNFNPTFARGHLQAIRDTKGPERIVSFLRFLVRINEHAEKKTLSLVNIVQAEGNSKQARIANVVDYISKNFAEDISLYEAANMAGMSASAFSRHFKKITGNKFVDFVNRIRIGQACSLLYASNEQISSICFTVGFQNLANFNRHFLRMKDITPSEYRKLARRELMKKESTPA